jgi:hypothetical protein
MSDLRGGLVDATFMNINTGLPNIKAGKASHPGAVDRVVGHTFP